MRVLDEMRGVGNEHNYFGVASTEVTTGPSSAFGDEYPPDEPLEACRP